MLAILQSAQQWTTLRSTRSNAQGNYSFQLPAGNYRLYFVDPSGRYVSAYYGPASTFDTAQILNLQAGSTNQNVNITLAPIPPPPPPPLSVNGGSSVVNPTTGLMTISAPRGVQQQVTVTRTVDCLIGSPKDVVFLVGTKEFTMTAVGNNQFTVTLNTPGDLPTSGDTKINVRYTCDKVIVIPIGEWVLFDPSGIVTDRTTGFPISGAKVSLYRMLSAKPDANGVVNECRTITTRTHGASGVFGEWSGEPQAIDGSGAWVNSELILLNNQPEISPALNPQTTGADGRYGWDVDHSET